MHHTILREQCKARKSTILISPMFPLSAFYKTTQKPRGWSKVDAIYFIFPIKSPITILSDREKNDKSLKAIG